MDVRNRSSQENAKYGATQLPFTRIGSVALPSQHSTRKRPAPHALLAREAPGPSARLDLLHEVFEAQADARPDAVAVVFGREKTTYASLEQSANRVARPLRARGVRRGSLVAMLLPRSADAQAVGQRQRFSQVPFGSQVDLIVPLSARLDFDTVAEIGDHVKAGSDPIIKVTEKIELR